MGYFKIVKRAFQQVYAEKKYYGITILGFMVLMVLNAIFRNYKVLFSSFSFSLLFSLVIGLWTSFTFSAFLILVILCGLGGILIAFSIFLLRRQLAMSASVGISGIVVAVVAPACSACALGLFGLLGISGVLAFLPLKGLEFALLGIIIVLFSLVYLSKKITTTVCVVNPKKRRRRRKKK